MSKTIVLIGLSGCGKSTYGLALSQKLNRPFYDIDQIIEENMGMTIKEIFQEKGESFFRTLEWETFIEHCQKPESIISTGGGLVPTAFMKGQSKPKQVFFLYLNTSVMEIAKRLSNPEALKVRPLIQSDKDLYKQIEKLYNERSEAYLSWADGILSTN